MEMREWLSIIVIVAIVLIVADGFRRKRKERNPVKMKLDRSVPQGEFSDEDEASAELPSGGARTIPRDLYQAKSAPREKVVRGMQQRKSKMERTLDLEEKVPVLMDSVAIQPGQVDEEEAPPRHADSAAATHARDEAVFRNGRKSWDDDDEDDDFDDDYEDEDEDDFDEDEDEDEDDDFDDDEEDEDDFASTEYDGNDEYDEEYDDYDDEEEDSFGDEDDDYDDEEEDDDLDEDEDEDDDFGYDDEDEDEDDFERFDRTAGGRIEPRFGTEGGFTEAELENGRFSAEAGQPASREAAAPARAPTREAQGELPLDAGTDASQTEGAESLGDPEEVIVINVMARKGETFAGKDMLPVLMKQGLRLGDMSIFHRHADSSGNGPVIFSMANMVKPGTFDMAGMNDFSTPGLSLFQQLPGPNSNMKNFDKMLAAATALRDALGGELKDEHRSVLTRQTIEHYRQRIRDFELRQLARK